MNKAFSILEVLVSISLMFVLISITLIFQKHLSWLGEKQKIHSSQIQFLENQMAVCLSKSNAELLSPFQSPGVSIQTINPHLLKIEISTGNLKVYRYRSI